MQLPGGQICVPQDDGTLLTLDGVKLRKFSGNIQELWAVDGEFHHQITVVNEKIIALRAATIEEENKKIKHDFVVVLDQNGKIENQFSVREWLIAIGKAPQVASLFPGSHQYTHINSIESFKDRLYFNDYVSGLVFSLKIDLTDPKFEWNWSDHSGLKTNDITRGHDFRWMQNGTRFSKMVFINKTPNPKNSDPEKKSDLGYRVSISDPKKSKPKYYPELSIQTKSTEHAGGALKIGNGILTTAVLSPVTQTIKETQVLWIDLKTAKVKANWTVPFYIQDLELFDLSQFQKKSRFFTAALGAENSQRPNRTSLVLKSAKTSNPEKSFVFSFSSPENEASMAAASKKEGSVSAVSDIRKDKKVIQEKFNGSDLKIHLIAERKLNTNQALSWAKNKAKKFESFFVEDVDPYSKKKTNYKECLIKRDLTTSSKNPRIDFYVGPENFWFQCFANSKSIKGFRTWIECDGKALDLIVSHKDATNFDVECSGSN